MPNYRQDRLRVSTGAEHARGDTVSTQGPGRRQGMSPLPRPVLVRRCVSAQKAADVDGPPRRSPRGVTASGR